MLRGEMVAASRSDLRVTIMLLEGSEWKGDSFVNLSATRSSVRMDLLCQRDFALQKQKS